MPKHMFALCIGIDDYPGGVCLAGCANDARDWSAELARRGFVVRTLTDSAATRAAVVGAAAEVVGRTRPGDVLVLTWSGHGACFSDEGEAGTPGREDSGTAGTTKAVVCGLDPSLRDCLAARRAGVRLVAIADCCHAGAWAKHVPLALDLLLAGCREVQRCWDGHFLGRANGAFTRHALDALRGLPREASYDDWFARIRTHLPSTRAPQEPQIFGSQAARSARVFG